MKLFLIFIVFLTLISCASKKRSEGKDIGDITELDFKPPKEIRYKKAQDRYNIFDLKKTENNSLAEETIQGIKPHRFEKSNKLGENIDDLLHLANLCYQNRFKEAVIYADNIYPSYRKHPGYWNQLGSCYFLKNELRKASIFYKQSLKYDKNYSPAYNNIGNIHIRYKQYGQALAAYEKAHELKKNSLTPSYNLAQLYLNFGTIGKAQELLLIINKRRPGDFKVISSLASTYLFQGNIKKSLFYFKKIPRRKLKDPFFSLNYVIALMVSGNKEMAKKVFNNISNKRTEWKDYYLKVKKFVRKK